MIEMKKLILPTALGVAAFVGVVGGTLLSSTNANAATPTAATTNSATTSSASDPPAQRDPSQGGHVGSNGTKEELLTGDTATKAKAAAEATVPGATVLRVENDAEGATYEAHMQKSDGTQVTVKMDANFKVTGTETGRDGPGAKQSSDMSI